MKILIIEDEPNLNASILEYLSCSYLCESVHTYKEALEKIDVHEYDCIVLDVMLPDGSGLQLLQYLKDDRKNDGVIIISAKDGLEDKLKGLALGADDYLTKPFHLSELRMRIEAIIRRRNMNGQHVLSVGNIVINTQEKLVTVNSNEIELTQKEYQLLLYFIINKNKVLSKSAIAQHLWGDEMDMSNDYDFLYTHIKNLRKKITVAGGGDPIISVYGIGYKLQAR